MTFEEFRIKATKLASISNDFNDINGTEHPTRYSDGYSLIFIRCDETRFAISYNDITKTWRATELLPCDYVRDFSLGETYD